MATNTTADARTRYWYQQIKTWQASGQSQQAFCNTHDLNYPRFVYWLRKFRRQASGPQPGVGSDFVPVICTEAPPSDVLCLVLPNGMELRGITSHNLTLVHQLLEHWS